MKFGGTSVGSVESLLNVKRIVEAQQGPVIVVVSALGGVTNQLIEMTRLASAHDAGYEPLLAAVRQRHMDVIEQVVPAARQHQARQVVEQFVDGNLTSFFSMLCLNADLDEPERRRLADTIVCHGEILSSASWPACSMMPRLITRPVSSRPAPTTRASLCLMPPSPSA